jgi:hypothetical protein
MASFRDGIIHQMSCGTNETVQFTWAGKMYSVPGFVGMAAMLWLRAGLEYTSEYSGKRLYLLVTKGVRLSTKKPGKQTEVQGTQHTYTHTNTPQKNFQNTSPHPR